MQRQSLIRAGARVVLRLLFRLLTRCQISGVENVPASGALLVAINHLGHLDAPLAIAAMPREAEAIALSDLYRVPVTGQLLRLYGAIPVHRDELDRTVIRRALEALAAGRPLILAPEARQSLTGALEKARHGAAYLALRANVPVLPVAITGTEASKAYAAFKRLRRPRLTLTIGQPFTIPPAPAGSAARREHLEKVTEQIMQRIAALLPPEYRGYYA